MRESSCREAWRLAELVRAEAHHDGARHAKQSAERTALLAELTKATGLGGKPRRSGSPTEKAGLNVTRTIRHALGYLSSLVPELAAHLGESLVTGVVFLRAACQHLVDHLTRRSIVASRRRFVPNERGGTQERTPHSRTQTVHPQETRS